MKPGDPHPCPTCHRPGTIWLTTPHRVYVDFNPPGTPTPRTIHAIPKEASGPPRDDH